MLIGGADAGNYSSHAASDDGQHHGPRRLPSAPPA